MSQPLVGNRFVLVIRASSVRPDTCYSFFLFFLVIINAGAGSMLDIRFLAPDIQFSPSHDDCQHAFVQEKRLSCLQNAEHPLNA